MSSVNDKFDTIGLRQAEMPVSFLKLRKFSLLVETVVFTGFVILAISLFQQSDFRFSWLITPCILVAGAVVPTAFVRKEKLSSLGFVVGDINRSLFFTFLVCVVSFLAVWIGLWLLGLCGVKLGLQPVFSEVPDSAQVIRWMVYQFLYVGMAEEVFFRGYVQGNILRITKRIGFNRPLLGDWFCIIVSAAIFAVAHIVVGGQLISILTFFPGIILGWLFLKTGSLIAPVLFHALANIYYLCLVGVFC